jgi:hypothetical protein
MPPTPADHPVRVDARLDPGGTATAPAQTGA